MNYEAQEAAVLENIVPQLEADGYEVIMRPSRQRLPLFMQSYSPDAIALREDKNLAIEVLRKGSQSKKSLDQLRELLVGHRDWELRVYWVSPSSTPDPIAQATPKDIGQTIARIEDLASQGQYAPALLMAWAALEALGRALAPEKIARPQTPGRLIEVLASDGYLTPSEADHLRDLARARNGLIHGALRTKVAAKDIKGFAAILTTLLKLLQSA
jgi:uncharacterized protein YutE (UPF0331/DUF86 family)